MYARKFVYLVAIILPVVQSISVVGPRVLRPHSTYRVALAPGPRSTTLFVAVEGRKQNGEFFSQGREVQLQPGIARILDLDIIEPGPGKYELVARSTSGPQFSSSAPLVYQNRSFAVFVQTDKRVYQPGDTISFRVIALDKYLLPISGPVDVSVLDSGGSPVRQWLAAPLDRGLLSADLTLADEPALGEWTLQVEISGQSYESKVLVADFVMPKFDMRVDLPKQVLFSDGSFTVNVTARHFNGLPVNGELTLAAYPVFFSDVIQPVFSSPTRKVVNITGNTLVTFNIKTDLNIAEDAARPLVVEAILEEKDTLRRQNVSGRTLLVRTPYRLKVHGAEHFKPNLPYKVQLELVDNDDNPLDADGAVSVERVWDDGAPANVTSVTLNKGLGVYSFVPDKAHTNSTLNILVRYQEVTERITNVRGAWAPSGQHLTVDLLSRDVTAGGDLRARITATEPVDFLHYVVIGRGDILVANTMEVSPASITVDIRVKTTAMMAPGCILLAWYPRIDTYVLATSIYIPIGEILQNKVEVTLSPSQGRPGGSVELGVSAARGSHAAILGADERARQAGLASDDGLGNGLSLLLIEREMESFSGLSHSVFKDDERQPSLGTEIGESTASAAFQKSGLVILTDAVVNSQNPTDQLHPTPIPPPETGTRPPLAGPYAFSRLPTPPAPRYYLPVVPSSTWLLSNFSIGPEGKGFVSRRTPIINGDWTIGAFAIHPILGLGLATPGSFSAATPLSLNAELPSTLQRGEALVAVITVTSTLTTDSSVEVTFHNSEQYFEFEPLENDVDSVRKIELFKRQKLKVPAKGSASTAFLITPVKTGEAPVLVEANGNLISASLFRSIDVKDGQEEEIVTWALLDARRGTARANISLDMAAGATPGTRLGPASVRAAGDLLAPALHALKKASVPAASPPQAVHPLALSCVLLDYLQATQHDDVGVTAEARLLASSGYQRLLAYRMDDGSFTSELNGKDPDTWMTALAARWLGRSARHLPVSPDVATRAARWLADAQTSGGSWLPPVTKKMQNPLVQRVLPLTAYSMLALIESQGGEVIYKNAINKAIDYIARHLSDAEDPYTLALLSYTLSAVRHPERQTALQMLHQYSNSTDTMRWWGRNIVGKEFRNPWLRGNTADAATAAWGLRALLAAGLVDDAVPVGRYLLASYHVDTHDADELEALAELAMAIDTPTKLSITATVPNTQVTRQFNIDDDNALIVQTQLVSGRNVTVSTEGRGTGCVGLSAMGTTNVTAAWPRYTLDPRVDNVSTAARLQLSICTAFVPSGNETQSGFTLLTVQLPSGYTADLDTLTALQAANHVSVARLANGGTRVLAWLRPLDARERCATLAAPRTAPIARPRPGWASLRDLYDSSHRARVFFRAQPTNLCDVCRHWSVCDNICYNIGAQTSGEGGGTRSAPGAAASLAPFSTAALIITTALLI